MPLTYRPPNNLGMWASLQNRESPDNLVEHLVELAAERKVYVRPTSAGIAAEAELVLPGSTRALRTPEPLAAPAHQVHIHVEHLHSILRGFLRI